MDKKWFCTSCNKTPEVFDDTWPPGCGHCGTILVELDEHLKSLKKDMENKEHAHKKKDWRRREQ